MSLALSKTLDPADFDDLHLELAMVDAHFTDEREQHPMRRWEYALALRALSTWRASDQVFTIADVGGAGSPFHRMLASLGTRYRQIKVIDPDEDGGLLLSDYLQTPYAQLFQAVFCLSVIEHVDDLDEFLYHLSCLVAPGGLLFLTMDYAPDNHHIVPIDGYHFHWMRKRIFNAFQHGAMAGNLIQRDFQHLGSVNDSYQQPTVYDYTFASLALQKRG